MTQTFTASNFATIRKFHRLTQEKTAALLGVTQSYIGHIETGRAPVTRSLAKRLTVALALTPEKITAIVEAAAAMEALQAQLKN